MRMMMVGCSENNDKWLGGVRRAECWCSEKDGVWVQ